MSTYLALPRWDYLACVNRATARGQAEVYAFTVRERLPRLRIPLRSSEADVALDLPTAFSQAYEEGDYALRVDYAQAPPGPLRTEDAAWADELLHLAGLRAT